MHRVFLAIFLLTAFTSSQPCPDHPKIGNPINFVHLFKEQADSDWSYLNQKTAFRLVYHEVLTDPVTSIATHRIIFQIDDTNFPNRTWYYLILLKYDSAGNLLNIINYARFRKSTVPVTDQCFFETFFGITGLLGCGSNIVIPVGTTCPKLTKMEYDYFYYLFTNYYNQGLGLTVPLNP